MAKEYKIDSSCDAIPELDDDFAWDDDIEPDDDCMDDS